MCNYDDNISASAVNKTEWVPRFRFAANYDMFGDVDGERWIHNVLSDALDSGKITGFRVFCSLTGYFGLQNITFSFDVDIPGAEGFSGMLEKGSAIASEIVHDGDAKAHGVTLLNATSDVSADTTSASDAALQALREKLLAPRTVEGPYRNAAEHLLAEINEDQYACCAPDLNLGRQEEELNTLDLNPGKHLCYDDWSGRYFYGSMEFLEAAVARVNEILICEGEADLNTFYDTIGLSPLPMGVDFGWSEPIRLVMGSIVSPKGAPAISMSFRNEPKPEVGRR